LQSYAESITGKYQSGFRIGRSMTDRVTYYNRYWKKRGNTVLAHSIILYALKLYMIVLLVKNLHGCGGICIP
jgi:hypothetical protein